MNDLERLREAWERPAPPTPEARSAARRALLSRAAARPRANWRLPALAVAAVTAVVVAGTTLAGGSEPATSVKPVVTPSAHVTPTPVPTTVVPPRDNQWIYTRAVLRQFRKGTPRGQGFTPGSPPPTEVFEFWTRADGRRVGYLVNGKLTTSNPGAREPDNTYALLVALPTAPAKLLAAVRDYRTPGQDPDDWLFRKLEEILRRNPVPPAHEVALFKALSLVRGATVDRSAVGLDGAPVLSVSRIADGWRRVEVLFDPRTHAYRGVRETAVADHTELWPGSGVSKRVKRNGVWTDAPPEALWTVEKGTVWFSSLRTGLAVVDRAGQRP
ncbi:hypothetical protein [Nonomuraea longicatena]|uniref:CU044_5270 family protein n=1 Tax=Nonomuraea longicatena TaxID=83682 RepID=A0ABP3Z1N5_9ACTN